MVNASHEKKYTYQEYLDRFSRPSEDREGRTHQPKGTGAQPGPKEVGREMAKAIISRLLAP
jgi:hypothetical protein